MLQEGRQTDGVVVAIDVGVRGLKSVEVQFARADGRSVVGRDIHKTQWFAANDIGDPVRLYYDPRYAGDEPPNILIDRGLWIWANPAFLVLGGIALLALGALLARRPHGGGSGRV